MVSKIFNSLNSINGLSKKIIFYVSLVSLVLCLCGMGIILYNLNTATQTIALHKIGSTMIYSSITLFAEFIVGSLIIDLFNTIISNNNDD